MLYVSIGHGFTSYTMRNFEDVVIRGRYGAGNREVERSRKKWLLATNVLEEYTIPEVARLLGCTLRTVELLQDVLDQLSRIPLAGGLMEQLPSFMGGSKTLSRG
jgi:hypothetical protein